MGVRCLCLLCQVGNFHHRYAGVGEQFVALAVCDKETGLSPSHDNPRDSCRENELGAGTRSRLSLRAGFQRAVDRGCLQARVVTCQFRQRQLFSMNMTVSLPGVSPADLFPVLVDDDSPDREGARTRRALVGQFDDYPHPFIIRRSRPSHLIPFSCTCMTRKLQR